MNAGTSWCVVVLLAVGCGAMPAGGDGGAPDGGAADAAVGGGAAGGGSAVDSGTGGGAMDAGPSGGGTGRTCAPAPAFAQSDLQAAGYSGAAATAYFHATLRRALPIGGRYDVLTTEAYGANPVGTSSVPPKSYRMCELCVLVSLSCDASGLNCAQGFLAQSGAAVVSAATPSADAGSFAFQLSDLVFEEWDFFSDQAVADGGCLTLSSVSVAASWP